MARRGISRILGDLAEFGAVAIFIAMVLMWADALPVI
jgi:hypothetical protein